jgi:hypothetical protein
MTNEQPAHFSAVTSTGPLYIDAQTIEKIEKIPAAPRQLNYSKLLRLIQELNDNYAKGNAYAAHALLRSILDHIPPALGCDDFKAVANNYSWGRTDKAYMQKLLDFKSQANDALHRKISSRPDLLSIDDMPPRIWINRLLMECDGSNNLLPESDNRSVGSRALGNKSAKNANTSTAERRQAPRLNMFQHQRIRGDISIGDLRIWISTSILGGIVAIAAYFAFRTWPPRFVGLNYQTVEGPDPHRYICYSVIAVGLFILVISILEGIASVRPPQAELSQDALAKALNRPTLRKLRSVREVASLTASLLIFSGLAGFDNYQVPWSVALAAVGALALISLTRITVGHGGDCLLAGTILLFAGTFMPINLDGTQPTFGVQTFQGALIAVLAVLLGVGWLYLWASSLLILLTLLGAAMMALLWSYDQHVVIGPSVVLVACAVILVAVAQGSAARPIGTVIAPLREKTQ